MSVCVRFLLGGSLHEAFLEIVQVTDLSGRPLASVLMEALKKRN